MSDFEIRNKIKELISKTEKYNILFSDEKRNNISKLLDIIKDNNEENEQNEENELEIRFQSLSYNQFEKIKNTIENDKLFINKSNIKTKLDILLNDTGIGDNIRHEKDLNNNTIRYQIKDNIYNFHLDLEKSKIKFSFSKEININPNIVAKNKVLLMRNKDRTRYDFEIFKIDLTIVHTYDINKNTNFKTYEVEIEFNLNYEKDLYMNFYISLIYILKILYSEKIGYLFIDKDYENKHREAYKKIFTRNNQFPQFYNKPDNFILENKPKNFKLENINTFNHSITNKLNGVNFFLFYSYDKNSLCLINHSTIEILGKDKKEELEGNIVIQGELFKDNGKNTFYIFDVLIINDNSVINLNHKDRCKSFEPLLNYFNDCINNENRIQLVLEYKKFYGFLPSENNFYENLMNCKNSLKKDYQDKSIDMEINDGFIFTPLNKPYINSETYKYKFPETMTIDFLVRLTNKSDKTKYYDLYVYNERKESVKFMYKNRNYTMKCSSESELFNLISDNMIVECKYDKTNNLFVPYRIRYDKILPNFYRVANDVFNDILNPITINVLEDLFKKNFYKESNVLRKEVPKSSYIQVKTISIENTLQVELKDILECVLYSVSPEYRNINTKYNKTEIYKSAISIFKESSNNILSEETSNLTLLAKNFNIKIYILKSTKLETEKLISRKYEILNESENVSENILYIVKNENLLSVLGYKVGKYEVFIF
jgi:hypothetical protein